MLRRNRSILLLLIFVEACATGAPEWRGIYNPVSEVCAGQVLTIDAATVSYADCKNAAMKVLSQSDREFSFEVSSEAKCMAKSFVFSMASQGSDVNVTLYRSAKDKASNIPVIECTYTRQKK